MPTLQLLFTSFRIFQLYSIAAVLFDIFMWLRVPGIGNPFFLYISITMLDTLEPF